MLYPWPFLKSHTDSNYHLQKMNSSHLFIPPSATYFAFPSSLLNHLELYGNNADRVNRQAYLAARFII